MSQSPSLQIILLDLNTKDEVVEWLKLHFRGERVSVRYQRNKSTGEYTGYFYHGYHFYCERVLSKMAEYNLANPDKAVDLVALEQLLGTSRELIEREKARVRYEKGEDTSGPETH